MVILLLSTHLLTICYKQGVICNRYNGECKRTQSPLLQSSEEDRHTQIIRIGNTRSLHCNRNPMELEIGVVQTVAVTSYITLNIIQKFSVT